MKKFLISLLILPSLSFGIAEGDYAQEFKEKVRPFYDQGESGYYQATASSKKGEVKDVKNGYHIIKRGETESENAIVILPGRTEPIIKYAELTYDFRDLGMDFYLMNHRGQGESSRLLEDGHKGYVREYENFRKDLKIFLDQFVLNKGYKKIHLIAHSMGGAIALDYLANNPNPFASVTTIAPMLEIETGKYSHAFAKIVSRSMILIGKGKDYTIGQARGAHGRTHQDSLVTSSAARHYMARDLELENEYLLMGGVTHRWINEILKAGKRMFKERKKLKDIPILMFQAGDDHYVRPSRQNDTCDSLKFCKLVHYETAKHEILQESDPIRDSALKEIRSFILSH